MNFRGILFSLQQVMMRLEMHLKRGLFAETLAKRRTSFGMESPAGGREFRPLQLLRIAFDPQRQPWM
jgi:hypothetical protein